LHAGEFWLRVTNRIDRSTADPLLVTYTEGFRDDSGEAQRIAEVLHGATTRAVTFESAGTAEVFQVGPGTAFGVAADPGMPFFVGDRDIHPPEGVAI